MTACPAHKACKLVNGITIHRLFGVNPLKFSYEYKNVHPPAETPLFSNLPTLECSSVLHTRGGGIYSYSSTTTALVLPTYLLAYST